MTKEPRRHGKHWSKGDVARPRELARGNTPTRVIGLKLGCTPDAVTNKVGEGDNSLKPTNQRPYNRRRR